MPISSFKLYIKFINFYLDHKENKYLQNFDELLESGLLNSCLHNLHHLLDDKLLVGTLGVASGFNLFLGSLGEGNSEESEDESIGSLGLDGGLNKGVPFLDHGTSFISRDVHSIEVGVAIKTFNFINLEFELSPGLGLSLVVAISKRDVEHTTFHVIRCLLLTLGLVAWTQSNASFVESWGKDIVPFLLIEGVSAIRTKGQQSAHTRRIRLQSDLNAPISE